MTSAIKSEGIREHEPLMELVRRIVGQQADAYSDQEWQNWDQPRWNGEAAVPSNRNPPRSLTIDRMINVLKSLSPLTRDGLTKFYFGRQRQETICGEMQISLAEFLMWKAALKASYYEQIEGQSWL